MADVAVDPKSANPKELYGQGMRAFVLQDYDTAVLAFGKACELFTAELENELHDSLGDVYLHYGKALLELSRRATGPLGDGVLKNVEEESETEDIEEEADGEEENKAEDVKVDEEKKGEGDSSKTDDEKTEEASEATTKTDDAKLEEAKPEEDKSAEDKDEEDKIEETNDEAGSSSEKKEGENDEDPSELQIAWEILELAKTIFGTRGDDGRKNLAETHIILGEISLESGNFSLAIEDILKGLEIQKTLYGNDNRTIAETYFKLGGAYSTNGQLDEAIQSFNSALEYLQNKINNLKKDEHKEASAEEIEEIENLIPEIQEKIADMKSFKVEIANKMTSASTEVAAPKVNGNSEASSSKQVNDISHLVKRKRKDDEGQEEKPAKKPSP